MHAPGRTMSSRQNDACVHVALLGTQGDGGSLLTRIIWANDFLSTSRTTLFGLLVQDFFRISENVLSLVLVILSWKWVLGFSFSSRSCLIASHTSMPILWASRRSLCYVWRCYGTRFMKMLRRSLLFGSKGFVQSSSKILTTDCTPAFIPSNLCYIVNINSPRLCRNINRMRKELM